MEYTAVRQYYIEFYGFYNALALLKGEQHLKTKKDHVINKIIKQIIDNAKF